LTATGRRRLMSASAWWQAGVTALLLALLFRTELYRLVRIWSSDGNWSHGFVVPLFSLYFVYANRDRIAAVPVRTNLLGLVILLCGLALYFARLADILTFGVAIPLALVLCIFGTVFFLCGARIMRVVWLPVLYLLFAIPAPERIYVQLTMPLRRLAAHAATVLLNLIPGVQAENAGVTIELMHHGSSVPPLNVAEACSGMRLLMGLCALGVAYTYLADRPNWQRITMVLFCLPIAVFTNLVRVTTTGVFHVFGMKALASGAGHAGWGIVMYSLALGLFCLLSWILSRLFVEDPDAAACRQPP
jgi:exosortase